MIPLEVCFTSWESPDGFQFGAVIRDISVRKREELRIRYLAEHDTLTGLINRDTLHGQVSAKISASGAAPDSAAPDSAAPDGFVLMIMGIDGFHRINDMLGHACGDEVLKATADRLKHLVGDAARIARPSGDEFAVLLDGAEAATRAPGFAERISAAFSDAPIEADGRHHNLIVRIGVAIYPNDCGSAEEMFGCAHLALERAKSAGSGAVVFFDRTIRDAVQARLTLEAELAHALDRHEFELFYQPQVRLADNRLVGVEALIRWRHPKRGLVAPATSCRSSTAR